MLYLNIRFPQAIMLKGSVTSYVHVLLKTINNSADTKFIWSMFFENAKAVVQCLFFSALLVKLG